MVDLKKTSLDSGVRPEHLKIVLRFAAHCSTKTSTVLPRKAACFFAAIGTRSSSLILRQRAVLVFAGTSSWSLRSE